MNYGTWVYKPFGFKLIYLINKLKYTYIYPLVYIAIHEFIKTYMKTPYPTGLSFLMELSFRL